MQLKSGTLLQGGKYRIEKVLGQGGFGITYLAVQTNLKNRKVAIKEFFLKEHCERDSSTSHVSMGTSGSRDLVQKFKDKFVKEAETISEFRNHHIITIHDVFEENGTAYYVMEFLAGGSLKDRIPAEGLPESESLGYVRQICEALAYIHENNILHLDIKPSNILFRKEDEAVLIDFGISKHYDEAGGGQTSTTPVGVSRGYAPLEQNKQGGVSQFSPATDIYALGATLYALLTGQTPPDADEVNEDGLPPLPQRVSASVSNAVEKAMSPKRKARPQSIAEFMELLDTASAPVEIPAEASDDVVGEVPVVKTGEEEETLLPPEPPQPDLKPRSMKWPWILLYLIVGIVLVFILLLIFNDRPESSSSPSVDVPVSQIPVGASYKDGFLRVNGIEYPMVFVSGGSFDMGATSEQGSDASSREKPVHSVTLGSFRIGKYEVTQELWEAVMGSNPSYFKGSRHPVEQVTWNDGQRFINKLNELTGQNFRLPTEAEWEFAARGGNSSRGYKYSGSNSIYEVAWYDGNSGNTTHNVGTKSPNELGIYDMNGNVYEWCSDRYGQYSSASQTNPKGPGNGSNRVNRGGSWRDVAWNSRVSTRSYAPDHHRSNDLGFRLCLSSLLSDQNATSLTSPQAPEKPTDPFASEWESDLLEYQSLVAMGIRYSKNDLTLSLAKSKLKEAVSYEQKYNNSAYSDQFSKNASSLLRTVENRQEELAEAESLAAERRRAEEAAARAEADRKRNEISYRDGILRVNGVEYPMVYVSGGSFDMGATSEQGSDAYSYEQPVHRVTLSSYRIGKYEVTQELWEAVMGSNPSHFKGARRPVENVSWDDCQRFINKLNELTGQNFRLPTEAEWEFAARGGNSSRGYKYSGSNNVDNVAWYDGNSGDTTHNVGTKSPNELGVYDMSGNVSEWCSDWYGQYSSASQTNPKGPGSGSYRVSRGGSWGYYAGNSRVSHRYSGTLDCRSNYLGFRLCL